MKVVNILNKILIVTIFLIIFNCYNIKANTISNNSVSVNTINKWNIQLTPIEIELLSRAVQLEAGGESNIGKFATTETILNRIISPKYPNTLIEVLSQKGQFGVWNNIMSPKGNPTIDTYLSVCMVLTGQVAVLDIDSYHFNTTPIGTNPIKIDNQYYGK